MGDDLNPAKRLASLAAVVDAALRHSVDAVLIAGDLFDSARVRDDVIQGALRELRRLRQPAVIIPGNHDCVDPTSIYRRVNFRDAGDHIRFVGDPAGRHVVFEDKQLAVWARGIEDHHPGHRPLQGYRPVAPSYWRLVLTHGHYLPGNDDSYLSSQIREQEIAQLECDYVALGHWHRFRDVSVNGVKAFYSGSPGEEGEDFASANLVLLDPVAGVRVERVRL